MPVGTVNTSLNRALTLNTRSRDLTTSFWNLICILLVNRKINLFYSNLIICSQFQLRILMNRRCFWTGAIFCQFWSLTNRRRLRTGAILCQFRNFVNWRCIRICPIFRQFWSLTNWSCLGTGAIFRQFWNFVNWRCIRICPIFCQFWNFMNWSFFGYRVSWSCSN